MFLNDAVNIIPQHIYFLPHPLIFFPFKIGWHAYGIIGNENKQVLVVEKVKIISGKILQT